MPKAELKCIICGNDKVETVFVKLVVNGVDSAACAVCMPAVIHGPKGHRH